jgi:hypothetical protein
MLSKKNIIAVIVTTTETVCFLKARRSLLPLYWVSFASVLGLFRLCIRSDLTLY